MEQNSEHRLILLCGSQAVLSEIACSIRRNVKNIFLPPPEVAYVRDIQPLVSYEGRWSLVLRGVAFVFCFIPSQ